MPQHPQLVHDAVFYRTDEEFIATLVPFVREGLAHGQAVAAAVTSANTALLRDALGGDAAAVLFIDRDAWYQRPVTTVAGWRRVLTESTGRGHRRVRLIGEVGFGTGERHRTWTRYEAAVNQVFAEAPAWIVCPYDMRTLTAALLADARRTHPAVFDPVRHASDAYLPTEEFLTAVPEPMPSVAGAPILKVSLAVDGRSDNGVVAVARHQLRTALLERGWSDPDRLDDVLLAATEVIANGVRHGRGRRELAAWLVGRTAVCEVTDEGDGPADPLVGYRPPGSVLTGGRGLWIARQLCDALAIDRYDGLTRVRFALGPGAVPATGASPVR